MKHLLVMKINILGLIALAIITFSCCNTNDYQISLSNVEVTHVNNISSASGIEFYNNNFYVIGDDNPWLYTLNQDLEIIDQKKISSIDTMVKGRIPKGLKADFECIGIDKFGESINLVIISSGSVNDSRDTAYIIDITNPDKRSSKNLRPLFENIKISAKLPLDNEINIEGITFYENHVYLFHRGNVSENFVAKISSTEFKNYFLQNSEIPDIEIYWFDLPVHNNIPSGFSGACIHPNKSGIIFTASMEDTKSEVDDGEVSGSYIGYIPISTIKKGNYSATLLTVEDKPLAKKIESVCVIQNDNKSIEKKNQLELVCVCDNDDGTSDIIKLMME